MKSKLFFVVTLFWVLFISTIVSAQQEQITLSTYYPAPYGEYDELCAEKLLVWSPISSELARMGLGDCHIGNSLIVGAAGGGFSYDEIGSGQLRDGEVLIKDRLGIGTTNPVGKLYVSDGEIPGNGIDDDGDGVVDETGEEMVFTTNGNVGIGTTGPVRPLTILGNVAGGFIGPNIVNTNNTVNSEAILGFSIRSNQDVTAQIRAINTVASLANTDLLFSVHDGTNWVDVMAMKQSGNVGIGTTAPDYGRLNIVSPYAKTDTTLRNVFRLRTNDATNPFDLKVSVIGAAAVADRTFTLQTSDHLLSNDGKIALQPYGGNVGIGTTAPLAPLQIARSGGYYWGAGNGRGWLTIGSGGTYGLSFGIAEGGSGAGDARIWTDGGSGKLMISGGSASRDVLTIYNGNVGIGTTSPRGKLDVNGTIYQRGSVLHADYVFEPGYELESIEDHAAYMWQNKHLEAVPKAKRDEQGKDMVEIGAQNRGILEELEKAHVYIQQLNERIKALEAFIKKSEG